MNLNGGLSVYNRRKAYISSASSGYLRMNIGSRDHIDYDCDNTNSDAGSIQSTTSTRSYRSWRKAQKKRHIMNKFSSTRSLYGDSSETNTELKEERQTNGFNHDLHSYVGDGIPPSYSPNPTHNEEDNDDPPVPILSTIAQSSLDPYYSSSSLESLSSESDASVKSSSLFHPTANDVTIPTYMTSQSHQNTRSWLMSGSYQHNEGNDVIKNGVASPKEEEIAPEISNEIFKELKTPINGLNEISEIQNENGFGDSPSSYRMMSLTEEEIRDEDADTLVNNNYAAIDIFHEKNHPTIEEAAEIDIPLEVTSPQALSPLEVVFDESANRALGERNESNNDVIIIENDAENINIKAYCEDDVICSVKLDDDVIQNVSSTKDDLAADYQIKNISNDGIGITETNLRNEAKIDLSCEKKVSDVSIDEIFNSLPIIETSIDDSLLKNKNEHTTPFSDDVFKTQVRLEINTKNDVPTMSYDTINHSLNSDDVTCQSTKSTVIEEDDFSTIPLRRDSAEELAEIIVNKGSRELSKKSDMNGGSRGHVGNGHANHHNGVINTNHSTPRRRTRLPMMASTDHQSLCCCIIL